MHKTRQKYLFWLLNSQLLFPSKIINNNHCLLDSTFCLSCFFRPDPGTSLIHKPWADLCGDPRALSNSRIQTQTEIF